MYCKECGSQLSKDANFCPNCGTKTENAKVCDIAAKAVFGKIEEDDNEVASDYIRSHAQWNEADDASPQRVDITADVREENPEMVIVTHRVKTNIDNAVVTYVGNKSKTLIVGPLMWYEDRYQNIISSKYKWISPVILDNATIVMNDYKYAYGVFRNGKFERLSQFVYDDCVFQKEKYKCFLTIASETAVVFNNIDDTKCFLLKKDGDFFILEGDILYLLKIEENITPGDSKGTAFAGAIGVFFLLFCGVIAVVFSFMDLVRLEYSDSFFYIIVLLWGIICVPLAILTYLHCIKDELNYLEISKGPKVKNSSPKN